MTHITDHIANIRRRVDEALRRAGRVNDTVTIVAVSKRQPASVVREAVAAGLTNFGENYLQEGIEKIETVAIPSIAWHFVGKIQSNKTRTLAQRFSWVHTLDRSRIADRLNDQRPDALGPLDVLIQLNVDDEPQKGGIRVDELPRLAAFVAEKPKLRLRGVMGMPPASHGPEENRASFLAIAAAGRRLREQGFDIDTVSMGMSSDFELAIECGSSCIRIGTAIFGPRPRDRD